MSKKIRLKAILTKASPSLAAGFLVGYLGIPRATAIAREIQDAYDECEGGESEHQAPLDASGTDGFGEDSADLDTPR